MKNNWKKNVKKILWDVKTTYSAMYHSAEGDKPERAYRAAKGTLKLGYLLKIKPIIDKMEGILK